MVSILSIYESVFCYFGSFMKDYFGKMHIYTCITWSIFMICL